MSARGAIGTAGTELGAACPLPVRQPQTARLARAHRLAPGDGNFGIRAFSGDFRRAVFPICSEGHEWCWPVLILKWPILNPTVAGGSVFGVRKAILQRQCPNFRGAVSQFWASFGREQYELPREQ